MDVLRECEMLCMQTEQWLPMPPMNKARADCSAILVGGRQIYAIFGGIFMEHWEKTIERIDYNNMYRGWEEITYKDPHGIGATQFPMTLSPNDSKIYIFGGVGQFRANSN